MNTVFDEPTVTHQPLMARVAGRVRMTEGQLYTATLAVLVALLLTLTGLPNAHRRTTGLGGETIIPTNTEVTR